MINFFFFNRSRSANLSENALNITGYTLKYDKKDTTKLLRSKSFDEGSIFPSSTDFSTNNIRDILVRKEKKFCQEKLRKEKDAYCRSCSTDHHDECCEQLDRSSFLSLELATDSTIQPIGKVNSVREACAERFEGLILEFEILQIK